MDGLKPLIVTVLLVLLLYKGSVLYISVLLFSVTVAITYICFTLNTQLRLEKLIAYLIIRFSFKGTQYCPAVLPPPPKQYPIISLPP